MLLMVEFSIAGLGLVLKNRHVHHFLAPGPDNAISVILR